MATRSLSPKQIAERAQQHRQAVMVLARLAAKKAVQDQLRAQGVRVSLFPPRDIAEKASTYLASHPELYQQAKERAKRLGYIDPRCAELNKNAQTKIEPISTTSVVQISGSKCDIEREIPWLLAQQFRGRARQLVTRSKDNDCRICEGEYGRPDTARAAGEPNSGRLRQGVQREGKWR